LYSVTRGVSTVVAVESVENDIVPGLSIK